MHYYVYEISTGDASISGVGSYKYEDSTLAEANFHAKIATALKSELYTAHTVMVIREDGVVMMTHRFVRPVEVVEEVEEAAE